MLSPAHGQALLVINLYTEPQDVTVAFSDLGLGDAAVEATDVWTGKPVPLAPKAAAFTGIEPHGSAFLVLVPKGGGSPGKPPR